MGRFILIGLCVLCAGPMTDKGVAQETATRRTGFSFLLLPTSARDEALGATGVGSIGSAAAIMYNPAGLAFIERMNADFTYVDWYGNAKDYVAGIAAKVSKRGALGLSFQNYGLGSDVQDVSQYAISGAWGMELTDRFALGTTFKLIREAYADRNNNVFAFDLGAYFVSESRATIIALGAQNLSAGALGEPEEYVVPKHLRAGLLLDLISTMGLEPFPHYLDLAIALGKPIFSDGRTTLNVGIEYTCIVYRSLGFSLRGGHKSGAPIAFGGGLQFRTAGGRGIAVDYALRRIGYLGEYRIHILSVTLNL